MGVTVFRATPGVSGCRAFSYRSAVLSNPEPVFSAFSADFCCNRTNSSSTIGGSVGDKRVGSGASGDFGGGDSGEESTGRDFLLSLTIIVSEPLNRDGVFCEESLPESDFLNPESDLVVGLLSRSAGSGDRSGGRSFGFSEGLGV